MYVHGVVRGLQNYIKSTYVRNDLKSRISSIIVARFGRKKDKSLPDQHEDKY